MAPIGGPTRLRAGRRTEREIGAFAQLLGDGGPDTWLGDRVAGGPEGMRRYATDLRLGPASEGPLGAIRRSAFVDLGSVEFANETLRLEISWRSETLAPLFPVFSGWLTARIGEIAIEGRYVPPGGPLGFVADRALMHLAARYTLDWFLRELDHAELVSSRSPRPDVPEPHLTRLT